MKKYIKGVSLLLAAASISCCGLTACGSSKPQVDEKTIVVKCLKAGFGTDWLYEVKGKFETAYASQGYKVEILTPDLEIKGNTVIQELALGYDKMGVDLYLTSGATPDAVGELGDYGILVEDIKESVYNQTAIAYDGTEESKKVSEKISEDVIPFVTDSSGAVYGYNWAQTSGGLAVNTRKLALYGLEIPNTTNEMFDCFDKIYCGGNGVPNSIESGTYPITYIPGGNGYGVCFLYTLVAQYDAKFYEEFWSFQKAAEDGTLVNMSDDECKNVYNHPAIEEMLEVAFRTFDMMLCAPGTLSQGVDQAQAKIMDDSDGAVFMFNGDWMLNELKLSHREKLNDIDFVNYPVVSAVGTKLFGAGTSYNFNEQKCDELLSYIIDQVDENKEIEEIVAAVKADKGIDVAVEDVKEVARARGVSYSRGVEHLGYITKGTTKKDIASLFLRMMSSDDFGKTFNNTANGTSPYYAQVNTTSEYQFVKSASKIPANKYFSLISLAHGAKGYRKQLNLNGYFTYQNHIPDYISTQSSATIYTSAGTRDSKKALDVYEKAAKQFVAEEIGLLSKNWSTYKNNLG